MKEVTRYFYVFLMLFFGLGCDQPTTRLPLPQVLYGSVYIKCERPPHLLNLDHLIATCTSEESLAALESSQQIIGCTMEEGSVDPEDADFSLDRVEGGYRVVTNNGDHAGQEVPHIHFHILGGEPRGKL